MSDELLAQMENRRPASGVEDIPVFLDGSDGSMWLARDAWEHMLANPDGVITRRRFIRVSDFLAFLTAHNITL